MTTPACLVNQDRAGSDILGITFGWGLIAMWLVFALDENIRGFIFVHRWNSFKCVGLLHF